jgi:hypothetical protein
LFGLSEIGWPCRATTPRFAFLELAAVIILWLFVLACVLCRTTDTRLPRTPADRPAARDRQKPIELKDILQHRGGVAATSK